MVFLCTLKKTLCLLATNYILAVWSSVMSNKMLLTAWTSVSFFLFFNTVVQLIIAINKIAEMCFVCVLAL